MLPFWSYLVFIESQNLGFWVPMGVPPPKGETFRPGLMCTIVQNFMPIGATVAEISVTENKLSKKHSDSLFRDQ